MLSAGPMPDCGEPASTSGTGTRPVEQPVTLPVTLPVAAPVTLPVTQNKRGRPRVASKAARKPRGTVRRVVPCYVDMGTLTRMHCVRYDAGQQLYDLADVLTAAYQGKVATVNKKLAALKKSGAFAGPTHAFWGDHAWRAGTDVDKVKWTDDLRGSGRGRHACSHRATTTMLRHSAGPRAPFILGAIACWISQNDPDSMAFLDTVGSLAPAVESGQGALALVTTSGA